MTPADIRKLADGLCPRDVEEAKDVLLVLNGVYEVALRHGSPKDKTHLGEALARMEALKP